MAFALFGGRLVLSLGEEGMRHLTTLLIGALGGSIGYVSGIPAGPMLGAIIAVGAFNLITDGKAQAAKPVRLGGRILLGTTIGALVTPAALVAVGTNIGWALAFTANLILVGLGCGLILAWFSDLDLKTALIGFSPGGMPEMTALAEEVGARSETVLGLHLARKLLTLAAVTGVVVVWGLG